MGLKSHVTTALHGNLDQKGGKEGAGTHKTTKPLLISNNRRAFAADKKKKKGAALTTSCSLIETDNYSSPAWPLGITLTYS